MAFSFLYCLGIFLVVFLCWSAEALAQPSRIILLRHAEKLDPHRLSDVGERRADALARQFLGKGAAQSLFRDGEKPEAFLAITPHTVETIDPAAESWGVPVTVYKLHHKHEDAAEKEDDLADRTRDAAHDLLSDPRYAGKTVVITWEHKHIAKSSLEKDKTGEAVTFRDLLGLDQIAGVPKTWPDSNFDYFWIVDYEGENPVPVGFRMVRQTFTAPFDGLPANAWGEPEPEQTDTGDGK